MDIWENHYTIPDGKLFLKVMEGKELLIGIVVFIVFAMAALNFYTVSGCVRLNQFVLNRELFKGRLINVPLNTRPRHIFQKCRFDAGRE